ncbi:hypothetical protein ACFSHT_10190 [Paraburkholderia silviterrae]|uniref:Type II toxin-antitoxin system HicA family toxin n=1 Tax=Paraburkholderia silviterrae TaxID=2528715 RepID=A0A4R5MDY8_9BURK|nr:type II toxin-antitoxin system HicA family toxin [Paraburkholderia silviterrae]TDG25328.1 type II toxin-antitoxin system HicA family toxin [Paraburkholderia silviterrae]
MNQRLKRRDRIRQNPKDVRFDDACAVAVELGFTHTGSGGTSHWAYSRPGEPTQLNFQNRAGKIPPYQAKQLISMMDKYEDEQS